MIGVSTPSRREHAAVEAHADYVSGEVLAVDFARGEASQFDAEIGAKIFRYDIEKA